MNTNRRAFLKSSAAAGIGAVAASTPADAGQAPPSFSALRPMTDGIVPITIADRRARIEKARRLMAKITSG